MGDGDLDTLAQLLAVAAERGQLVEMDHYVRERIPSKVVNAAHRRLTEMWADRLLEATTSPRPSMDVFDLVARIREGTARGAA